MSPWPLRVQAVPCKLVLRYNKHVDLGQRMVSHYRHVLYTTSATTYPCHISFPPLPSPPCVIPPSPPTPQASTTPFCLSFDSQADVSNAMVICRALSSSTSVVMGSKQLAVVARGGARAAIFINPTPDQSLFSSSSTSTLHPPSSSSSAAAASAADSSSAPGAAAVAAAGVGYFQPTGGDVPSIVLDADQAAAVFDYVKSTTR